MHSNSGENVDIV